MRIAIFRPLQLGDLLCAIPAMRAVRAANPEAEIALVGLPWARDFAARLDRTLDAFIEFPGFPTLPERECDFAQFAGFFDRMNALRFDLVIQMHGDGRFTNPLVSLMGGRESAGYYRAGRYCPDRERFFLWRDDEHEVLRWLRLVEGLGMPSKGAQLEFPLVDSDWRELEELRIGDLRFAVLHPGAQLPSRRWPAERFAEVADQLAADGLHVVLTGTSREEDLVRRVKSMMREPAIDLSGRTSLGGLAAVVSRARIVVCNDTGISHVAAAVRAPSVVIASGPDPERRAPLNRELHRVLWREGPSTGDERAAGVSVHDVLHEVRRLEQWAA